MANEPTMTIRASATFVVSETDTEVGEGRDFQKAIRERKYKATAAERVEGVEDVAERIYELLDDRHYDTVRNLFRELEEEGDYPHLPPSPEDVTVKVEMFRHAEAVALAAAKYAKEKTRENMTRSGYSPERVLASWASAGGFGYPDKDKVVFDGDLASAARHALFTFYLDQTEGHDIDADLLPEAEYSFRRDKGELTPRPEVPEQ